MSLDQLKLAQRKFQVCKDSLVDLEKATSSVSIREEGGSETVTGAEILVPLTSSVYVRGKLLAKNGKVLVDIGTGYFVEKVRCCSTASHIEASILMGLLCVLLVVDRWSGLLCQKSEIHW